MSSLHKLIEYMVQPKHFLLQFWAECETFFSDIYSVLCRRVRGRHCDPSVCHLSSAGHPSRCCSLLAAVCAVKMVKGFLSMLAFILGFKRFPFPMGKFRFKLKKKKIEKKEEHGKSQEGGCEKQDSKENRSSVLRLFRKGKNKPTE